MNTQHLHESVKAMLGLAPVALGAIGANAGKIIDRRGYSGVEFIVGYGAITTTGTVVTVVVREGDTTGALTSVADGNLVGTEALASLLAGARTSGVGQNVTKRIGYKGNKRYVQIDLVGSGTTSAGLVWADAILHTPEQTPVTNP